jgi:hypothetical protein
MAGKLRGHVRFGYLFQMGHIDHPRGVFRGLINEGLVVGPAAMRGGFPVRTRKSPSNPSIGLEGQ